MNRATMYSVRQAGREVKREAKRNAPVLQGRSGISRKQFAAGWESGQFGAGGNTPPVKGLLRASIGSSKRLNRPFPGTYGVNVAPRGERVHFYSQKQEARSGYMSKAYDAVTPRFREIAEQAYRRAMKGVR